MPQIIPIKELKDTGRISRLCKESSEPIYVTRNGYGDMVIMSMDTFESTALASDIHRKISVAEKQFQDGESISSAESLRRLRERAPKEPRDAV
jgi:PHD/YefM family antitoxin component YafN of YafNO toxin-antitoxin module